MAMKDHLEKAFGKGLTYDMDTARKLINHLIEVRRANFAVTVTPYTNERTVWVTTRTYNWLKEDGIIN